ncbi:hypothetical protein PM082_003745 [Marasmius tenuissimus]|nr:hypothetical protein PM082_003745 [Marasmius tenuissimus]
MDPHSPFTTVFSTNYAPSPLEVADLHRIIHEPEARIRELEAEISRLQSERDRLQAFVNNHRQLLSPVRRLPVEVLKEIFVQCLPVEHLPITSTTEFPLLLTRICRHWKEVAITTPHLWCSIHIYIPSPANEIDGDQFLSIIRQRHEGIERWLHRSGSVPLNISFSMGELSRDPTELVHEVVTDWEHANLQFSRILAEYSGRWASFTFRDLPSSVLEVFASLTREQLPQLISLYGPGNTRNTQGRCLVDLALASSTSLRSLQIMNASLTPLLAIAPRLTALTDLSIDTLLLFWPFETEPVTQTLGTLCRAFPFLRTLSLRLVYLDQVASSPDPIIPVLCPCLEELTIQLRPPSPTARPGFLSADMIVQTTFDNITAPALTHLSVRVDTRYDRVVLDGSLIHGFLLRSKCRLRHLEVEMNIPCESFLQCLQLIPDLLTLKLFESDLGMSSSYYDTASRLHSADPDSIFLNQELFESLAESSDRYSPILRCVRLSLCHPKVVDALLKFARSRRASLTSLSVDFGRVLHDDLEHLNSGDVHAQLKELQDSGVKTELQWVRKKLRGDDPRSGLASHLA